ncbi:hypothetical protein Q763_13995 [Flavobacterium beibuense F44-8]|uniref:Uncharacterized protein n=1 Tax=Flavobacterium beibuense F44-8 TaxID=1406840 RepID=A0A0A2LHF4_9FLAO|nr:hypothetical protein [Flavobacterium beibuense]KGO79344.1 hypothetical protein Q763_13995 [Flavobacterium beibuense F44-8]
MNLFEECIEVLGESARVLDKTETDIVFKKFENSVPITWYGRIDWENLNDFEEIQNSKEILNHIRAEDKCLVLWNDMSLPVIETTVASFLENIDDVLEVSFDTWLVVNSKNVIIEFFHDRLIKLVKTNYGLLG